MSFCLGSGPFPLFCFAVDETQIWPGDLRVVSAGGLCFFVCLICLKPRRFILNLAYPNVRTERNRPRQRQRKKKLVCSKWGSGRQLVSAV